MPLVVRRNSHHNDGNPIDEEQPRVPPPPRLPQVERLPGPDRSNGIGHRAGQQHYQHQYQQQYQYQNQQQNQHQNQHIQQYQQEEDPNGFRARGLRQPPQPQTQQLVQQNQGQHNSEYAVQSINRGSDNWQSLLKPFVSHLAYRSVVKRRYQSEVTFRPYNCQAALLFVDMSGYSKITAVLAPRGAHVLSSVVNAYLSRLLDVIDKHGGDVFKFAGDAILVLWEGTEQDLELNVFCAARCAVELQRQAGEHDVEGTDLKFRIHTGLCCGPLESEIFEAPMHNNMQRLYHSVGGESMQEIGDLVDLSKSGETCVSKDVFNFLENEGTYQDIPDEPNAKLLLDLVLCDELRQLVDEHIHNLQVDRLSRRTECMEEDFIHSSVLAQLSHGGLSPTQIAQMRNLCVLFIAMTSKGSSVNWLMEVQAILDKNRCPIVQIIDDDKGVHIVAAINLYEAVPETSLLGLVVCRALAAKRVGASVGAAIGPTFCGVTGSQLACRWDITGPAVVRAARLMQFALKKGVHFAIDGSLYADPMAATHMTVLDPFVTLKGTPEAMAVYTISDSQLFSAFRILDNVQGTVHDSAVQQIQNHIGSRARSAVVVTGYSLTGKKMACQRAAGLSDLVPFLHRCEESAGFLQLARTLATWYKYVDDKACRSLAAKVIDDMDQGCWSCAHDLCIELVRQALDKGFRACFVVDRIQFLDKFSLSLIRECLQSGKKSLISRSNSRDEQEMKSSMIATGTLCFLCVHVPLYNWKSAVDLVHDISRSHTSFHIPIITVGEAKTSELKNLFVDLFDTEVDGRWMDAYAEASGHSAGYFIERAVAIRDLSVNLWKEGKAALAETSKSLVFHIPPGLVLSNKQLTVSQICPELAMRFSQMYDELSPLCQMMLKILTISTRKYFYKLPKNVLWEVMNDLFAAGVDREVLTTLLDEMAEIGLVKIQEIGVSNEDPEPIQEDPDCFKFISIQSPALADIAMEVCTPVQVSSIARALITRLNSVLTNTFQVSLVLAGLHHLLNENEDTKKHQWLQAYLGFEQFLEITGLSDQDRINQWKEIFNDEIVAAGYTPKEIIGENFSVDVRPRPVVPPPLSMLKLYSAPIALGPMGNTMSVICRNTFHEYGVFSGDHSQMERVRGAVGSACGRYMMELTLLEDYLRENDVGIAWSEQEVEFDMLSFIANPAASQADVETKAVVILDEIIPRFVEHRLQRLRKLVANFRKHRETPPVMVTAHPAISRAYEALQARKPHEDAAQDALMILAVMNWKPRQVPETLPLCHHQTVANIRNKTLKRLSDAEVIMYRHQQTIDDLEAFLIVTAMLNQAHEQGLC